MYSHRNSRKLFAEIEPFNGLPPSAASHLSYLFVHCSLNRKEKLPPRIVFYSHHAAGTVASTWCSFLQRLAELGRRLKVVEEIFENMDKYQRGR
ncbi:hypothetical protein P8452_27305 [Trifolium repens]|nr:hypothetical protein P8452_27305 [Trifolium repens]